LQKNRTEPRTLSAYISLNLRSLAGKFLSLSKRRKMVLRYAMSVKFEESLRVMRGLGKWT
jgi:hypothetical protein